MMFTLCRDVDLCVVMFTLCRDVDLCVLKEGFCFRRMLVLGYKPGLSSISMITKCKADGS